MATDNILRTYADASRKEDVLGLVEILTAKENYFLTNLGKTVARDTVHQTMVDILRTPASGAVVETGDYDVLVRTTPTRLTNLVQKVVISYKVSGTQRRLEKHTGEDELTRQRSKGMVDWGNAVEFDLVRSTLVCGASGVVPKMSGILQGISKSNTYTAHTSGTALVASIIKGLMANSWNNSNGETPTELFVGSYLKAVIDGFTAGQTKYMMAKDAAIVDYISVYDSGGFGMVKIHTHRYLQQAGDANAGRVLAIKPDKLKIAYLTKPTVDTLARSGDYDFEAVMGEMTLEVRNQDTHFFAEGFYNG